MSTLAGKAGRRDAALALLLVVPLAGCAGDGVHDGCPKEFPLSLQSYPAVNQPGVWEFQSTLWNCTTRAILLDEPCEGRNGVLPRVVIANVTYVPGAFGNRTLVPAEDLACDAAAVPRTEAPPGFWSETRHWWDGTYQPEDGDPVPVPPGVYAFTTRAGFYTQRAEVTVPWQDRA